MLLIPINSIISFLMTNEKDILKYFVATIPFIIALIVYAIFKRHKFVTNSILYFFCSILCILFAPWDSPTGVFLLCLAIYTWNNKVIMWQFFIFTILTIGIKTIFTPEPTTRIINYILVYAWFIALYFIKFHPGVTMAHNSLEDTNQKIMKLLVSGYHTKEIADKICISQNAVSKRIGQIRVKFDCKSNEQMIYYMIEKGIIRLK